MAEINNTVKARAGRGVGEGRGRERETERENGKGEGTERERERDLFGDLVGLDPSSVPAYKDVRPITSPILELVGDGGSIHVAAGAGPAVGADPAVRHCCAG